MGNLLSNAEAVPCYLSEVILLAPFACDDALMK